MYTATGERRGRGGEQVSSFPLEVSIPYLPTNHPREASILHAAGEWKVGSLLFLLMLLIYNKTKNEYGYYGRRALFLHFRICH